MKLGLTEQRQHHKERRDGQSAGIVEQEAGRASLKLPRCTKNQIVKNTPELTKHVCCCDHMPSLQNTVNFSRKQKVNQESSVVLISNGNIISFLSRSIICIASRTCLGFHRIIFPKELPKIKFRLKCLLASLQKKIFLILNDMPINLIF